MYRIFYRLEKNSFHLSIETREIIILNYNHIFRVIHIKRNNNNTTNILLFNYYIKS